MNEEQIKFKVLQENEKSHDAAAKNHTRSVPYQYRRNTRNYIYKLILNQLKDSKIDIYNCKILEVACGTGTFVKLAEKYNCQYHGIDISNNMIQTAKRNSNYKKATFEKISLEDFYKTNQEKYDIIISSSFIHHLYDVEEGLIQIRSMLKDNGIYIALHEEINNRKHTKIEILDKQLSWLFGYEGHIQFSLSKRIKRFIKYLFPKLKIKVDELYFERGTDYVDYQLNFDFNLTTNDLLKTYGKVIPYCYYTFPEFRFLSNVDNNCMFVMRAEQSRAEQSRAEQSRAEQSSNV